MGLVKIAAKTLKETVTLTGVGLHSGQTVTLRVGPQSPGRGIVFQRTDLPDRPTATVQDVLRDAAPFRTVIKKGNAEFHTVEHVLSALAALGITDALLEMDGLEVPGMDGSAVQFAEAIQKVGLRSENNAASAIVLEQPVSIDEGAAKITAQPHAGGLKISYTLNYPGHALAQGSYALDVNEQTYIKEIAPARTFAIRKDAEAMRAAGLGKGANLQNTVVIDGDKALETTLRFADEPVRHKILDLIGDLYVLGAPLHAHIVATATGHRQNRELAAKIKEQLFNSTKGTVMPETKESAGTILDINQIKSILPHRYPFLLVDRIVELDPGKRIVGIKNVSANEPFFQGHFPADPIFPGVLILEALAQTSCVLVLRDLQVQGSIALFTGADNVSFRRKVVPGDQLRLEIEMEKLRVPFGRVKGTATVNGELCAEGLLKFMIVMPDKK